MPFILDPGKKIPKKIVKKLNKPDSGKKIPKKIAKKLKKTKKTSFRYYFQPKQDEIGRESAKKFLLPNAVHT